MQTSVLQTHSRPVLRERNQVNNTDRVSSKILCDEMENFQYDEAYDAFMADTAVRQI